MAALCVGDPDNTTTRQGGLLWGEGLLTACDADRGSVLAAVFVVLSEGLGCREELLTAMFSVCDTE